MTTATDVYALGVILYELLTGRHPTASAAHMPIAKARAIVETEPTPSLRGDLDNILAMALRKAPGERYQTAEAFADDLHRYLSGNPVRARADSAWYRFGKFLARNRIAACAAAVVLAAIAIAGGISVQQKREATAQRDRARALSARSGAVIEFVNSMLADVAPSQGPISIADLLERSYSKLTAGRNPPEHEAAVLALLAQFYSNNANPSRAERMLAAFVGAHARERRFGAARATAVSERERLRHRSVGATRRKPSSMRGSGSPARTILRQ